MASKKKLIVQGGAAVLILAVLLMGIVHHSRVSAQLKAAHNRLSWLEPEVPALCIEQHQIPVLSGEYNPAEFILVAEDKHYQRPHYTPEISTLTTAEPDWCFVPRLNLINQHRLFLFSNGGSYFSDLRGILHLPKLPDGWYEPTYFNLLVINCRVKDVFWNDNQLMVVVNPSQQGFQIIKVKKLGDRMPSAWLLDSSFAVWEEAYR